MSTVIVDCPNPECKIKMQISMGEKPSSFAGKQLAGIVIHCGNCGTQIAELREVLSVTAMTQSK